jgi:hypothetical protein
MLFRAYNLRPGGARAAHSELLDRELAPARARLTERMLERHRAKPQAGQW